MFVIQKRSTARSFHLVFVNYVVFIFGIILHLEGFYFSNWPGFYILHVVPLPVSHFTCLLHCHIHILSSLAFPSPATCFLPPFFICYFIYLYGQEASMIIID